MRKTWKKISSKVIFKHPRVTLIEDTVELPTGKRVTYLRYNQKNNAVTVIAQHDGEILVEKEYSYPPDEVLLQFPGGAVPEGEELSEGANRELAEETGLRAKKMRLLGYYYTNNRRHSGKMYVFLATDLEKASKAPDLEEDIELIWHTEKEVDRLIREGEIKNANLLAAWALYKERLTK